MTETQLLFKKAEEARLRAYAPYSKFLVGSSIKTTKNNYFAGCNIENASYSLTICAEACAIAQMVAAGEHQIQEMAVVVKGPGLTFCCGACRQRIAEFATPDCMIHFFDLSGTHESKTIAELLPFAFGAKDLSEGFP